jgi:predicted Zn-dependent protease
MFLRRRMYSRDMEREADDEAWRFLMASGIDPRGLLRFFERIHAEREELLKKNPLARIDESLGFLSTHPDTKERIERLKERWEREESKSGFREFPNDFSGTKQHVRALLHLPDPKSP